MPEGYRDGVDFIVGINSLEKELGEVILAAHNNGYSYSEIYTGLIVAIGIAMYDFEMSMNLSDGDENEKSESQTTRI